MASISERFVGSIEPGPEVLADRDTIFQGRRVAHIVNLRPGQA